jgi:hypothetical protein
MHAFHGEETYSGGGKANETKDPRPRWCAVRSSKIGGSDSSGGKTSNDERPVGVEISNVPQHSLIVTDNASYRNVQLNRAPRSASRKSEMKKTVIRFNYMI